MAVRQEREADILKAILAYLRLAGVFAWRSNTGAVSAEHNGKRRFVRFGVRGCSDVVGCVGPQARLLCVEVKRPGGQPTEAQRAWLAAVNAAGGLAFVAASVEDVRRRLREEGYDVP